MAGWDGFGKRLRDAMMAKGFVNRRGDPDVTRFALTNGWIPNYVYRWLADEARPDMVNLDKIGEILGIPPAHLQYGDEVNRVPGNARKRGARKLGCLVALGITLGMGTPSSGGSPRGMDHHAPAGSGAATDNVRGIMSSRWRRFYRRWGSPPRPTTSGSLILTAQPA
jgi:hypothetical protein